MAIQNLIRKVSVFAGKVKTASNLATLLVLAAIAYTSSLWHHASTFDNFINSLMSAMLLSVNIKFYKIHLALQSIEKLAEENEMRSAYKLQKKEYSQWLIGSLLMLVVVILLKLLLN